MCVSIARARLSSAQPPGPGDRRSRRVPAAPAARPSLRGAGARLQGEKKKRALGRRSCCRLRASHRQAKKALEWKEEGLCGASSPASLPSLAIRAATPSRPHRRLAAFPRRPRAASRPARLPSPPPPLPPRLLCLPSSSAASQPDPAGADEGRARCRAAAAALGIRLPRSAARQAPTRALPGCRAPAPRSGRAGEGTRRRGADDGRAGLATPPPRAACAVVRARAFRAVTLATFPPPPPSSFLQASRVNPCGAAG